MKLIIEQLIELHQHHPHLLTSRQQDLYEATPQNLRGLEPGHEGVLAIGQSAVLLIPAANSWLQKPWWTLQDASKNAGLWMSWWEHSLADGHDCICRHIVVHGHDALGNPYGEVLKTSPAEAMKILRATDDGPDVEFPSVDHHRRWLAIEQRLLTAANEAAVLVSA